MKIIRRTGYECEESPSGKHSAEHNRLANRKQGSWTKPYPLEGRCIYCGSKIVRAHSRDAQWRAA